MSKYKVRVLLYYIEDGENLFKDKFNLGCTEVHANNEIDIKIVQKLINYVLEKYEDMIYLKNDTSKIMKNLDKIFGD